MATTTKPTMSAAARAFELPELVEMILLHLPMKDLLFANHTSRICQDVAAGSSKLQQALWLTPGSSQPLRLVS